MTTTTSPVLTITRQFDATPERVFDAWLTREQWQDWIGPEGGRCDVPLLEPKVGGHYQLMMHIGERHIPVEGVFKVIERPTRLAFTWGWALSGNPDTLVSLTLRAVDGKTELTLVHEGLPTEEDRIGHGKGWNSTLNKLALYVKGELK